MGKASTAIAAALVTLAGMLALASVSYLISLGKAAEVQAEAARIAAENCKREPRP